MTSFSLEYGGGATDLVESEETVFSSGKWADSTTHFIYDANDADWCWVTGDDPSYYSEWGCETF